jgi:hypothetical protein
MTDTTHSVDPSADAAKLSADTLQLDAQLLADYVAQEGIDAGIVNALVQRCFRLGVHATADQQRADTAGAYRVGFTDAIRVASHPGTRKQVERDDNGLIVSVTERPAT